MELTSRIKLKKGWEVEWCIELPETEWGDADIDAAKYKRRDFEKKDDALAFAKTVLSQDQFGSVRVTPFEWEPLENEPWVSSFEFTGDPIYVD